MVAIVSIDLFALIPPFTIPVYAKDHVW